MTSPESTNPSANSGLFAAETDQEKPLTGDNTSVNTLDDSDSVDSVDNVNNDEVNDEPVLENDEAVDLGNNEADVLDRETHINDRGHLVDENNNKVFTTTEEALKDGSFVLDSEGRMPGVYLSDIEREQNEERGRRYKEAFDNAAQGNNSPVERQVNVANSPIPPVTVPVRQEQPVASNGEDVVEE